MKEFLRVHGNLIHRFHFSSRQVFESAFWLLFCIPLPNSFSDHWTCYFLESFWVFLLCWCSFVRRSQRGSGYSKSRSFIECSVLSITRFPFQDVSIERTLFRWSFCTFIQLFFYFLVPWTKTFQRRVLFVQSKSIFYLPPKTCHIYHNL